MKKIFITLSISLISILGHAQKSTYTGLPSLVWPKLYNIQFEKRQDDLGDYDKPIFSADVKALQGKSVILPGYMVPFEGTTRGNHFMLSSMPLNACFFCGVGGPETVVEVYVKNAIEYTEKPIQVRGVLKLNDKEPDKMIYLLEDAELEGVAEY